MLNSPYLLKSDKIVAASILPETPMLPALTATSVPIYVSVFSEVKARYACLPYAILN